MENTEKINSAKGVMGNTQPKKTPTAVAREEQRQQRGSTRAIFVQNATRREVSPTGGRRGVRLEGCCTEERFIYFVVV